MISICKYFLIKSIFVENIDLNNILGILMELKVDTTSNIRKNL